MFNVVLVRPEIPNNTGNVGRTCVGFECTLHLVGPLGFSMEDKYLKRAGLDYWHRLKLLQHGNWDMLWSSIKARRGRVFLLSSKARRPYYEIKFAPGDYLLFGGETQGLPEAVWKALPHQNRLCIPFKGAIRCFNLANAAAIVVAHGVGSLERSESFV